MYKVINWIDRKTLGVTACTYVPIRAPTAVRRGFDKRNPSAQRAHPTRVREKERDRQREPERERERERESESETDTEVDTNRLKGQGERRRVIIAIKILSQQYHRSVHASSMP